MKPMKVSQSGVGSSVWMPLDRNRGSFQVTIDCQLSGVGSYSVEATLDDVLLVGGPAPSVFEVPDGSGKSATALVIVNEPVSAVRITVDGGSPTVNATILQTGLRDG